MAFSRAEETIHRSAQAARAAMAGDAETAARPAPPASNRVRPSHRNDDFLDHYFKRIDPKVAASFTAEQCEAIKTMFGARGYSQHGLDFRRSFWFGGERRYLVLLAGREKRGPGRFGESTPTSLVLTLLAHLGFLVALLLPIFAIVYGLKAFGLFDLLALGEVSPKLSLLGELAGRFLA